MDLHNQDNVVQLNWVTGLPDVQRIIVATFKQNINYEEVFFNLLKNKGIEYTAEKNEGSQKFLIKIGGYTCILRTLDNTEDKTKTAFIEGWVPEHELITASNKWKMNKFITKEELTLFKNRTLHAINDAFQFCEPQLDEEPEDEEVPIEETIDLKTH